MEVGGVLKRYRKLQMYGIPRSEDQKMISFIYVICSLTDLLFALSRFIMRSDVLSS